jgi:hypothetical protein
LLDNAAVLSIEAGAVVCVAAIDRVDRVGNSGALLAEGSAQAPIRFVGTALRIADTLTHVRAENVLSVGSARPATRIEDSTFRWTVQRDPGDCAQVIVATDGTVRRTLIERYGSPGCAALRAGGPLLCDFYYCYSANATIEARIVASLGDGVSIDGESDVSFTNCQVSTSAGHGIVVAQTNTARVFVHRCNLFDNLVGCND